MQTEQLKPFFYAALALSIIILGVVHYQRNKTAPPAIEPKKFLEQAAIEDNGDVEQEGRLHSSFQLARIDISGKQVTFDDWEWSDELLPREKVRVAVVASWCPPCQKLIAELSRQPKHSRPVDFVVFYEDEVEMILDQMENIGQISTEQRKIEEDNYESNDQLLINPEKIHYNNLDYYFIESGQFDDIIDRYPSLVTCDSDECTVTPTKTGSCPKVYERPEGEVEKERRMHQSFQVASIDISGKSVSVNSWEWSEELVPKEKIKVAVIASWCSYCNSYLAKLSQYPKGSSPIDLIVLYENEVEMILDRQERKEQITSEQRIRIEEEYESKNQLLINPEKLNNYNLDYYFIDSGQFEDIVGGYPSIISCDPDGCKKVKR